MVKRNLGLPDDSWRNALPKYISIFNGTVFASKQKTIATRCRFWLD